MASCQSILADIDLRYRNTFTTTQKLVWLNEEQRELFDILEIDSPPYAFQTVQDENMYPFPAQFDVTKIKVVTMQINDNPTFIEIPFKRNDDNQFGGYGAVWYTIIADAFFLNYQQQVPGGRTIYIYCDVVPDDVTDANVTSEPSLPVKYQELLKLGVLKRITAARLDTEYEVNFTNTYEQKLADVIWERKQKEPEFSAAIDMLPPPNRYRGYARRGWF